MGLIFSVNFTLTPVAQETAILMLKLQSGVGIFQMFYCIRQLLLENLVTSKTLLVIYEFHSVISNAGTVFAYFEIK